MEEKKQEKFSAAPTVAEGGTNHIADGVAAAAQQEQWFVKAFHKLDAHAVPLEAEVETQCIYRNKMYIEKQNVYLETKCIPEVETPQPVARQRVGPALQHNGARIVPVFSRKKETQCIYRNKVHI